MKSLVTGAAGFAGGHLVRYLLERGDQVAGLIYPQEAGERPETLPEQVELFEADILEGEALVTVLSRWEPDAIYHLAAFSSPEDSWRQARRALETNILGCHNLLQGAVESRLLPRVLLVGSCQQYGLVPDEEQPIREDRSQRPLTPYGVSKASQEILGLRFFLSENLPVFLVRAFNHTGPHQAPSYVSSDFARQLVEIERGRREPLIRVGNLSARRDFTDVRDVVRAYRWILEEGKPGSPYNVCCGEAVTMREILDTLLELAKARVKVEVDSNRYHTLDLPLLVGDNCRLRMELGWEPRYSLRQTLSDLLDYWRERT